MKKRTLILLLVLTMIFGIVSPAFAAGTPDLNSEIQTTANFLLNKITEPRFGSIGGEWTVLSLARSGVDLPEGYIENYHNHIDQVVAEKQGNLTKNKFTEYSRLIVALTATGKDVKNVGGYDLVAPLANFDNVIKQGINGPIWALIALDTKGFELPTIEDTAAQNSRNRMIQEILDREVPGGGWSLMGDKADPDITAMALYALAPYRDQREDVKAAVDKGVNVLSEIQFSSGGYETMGDENSESTSQVIIALSTLGINPMTDKRFIKVDENGVERSPVDALLTFRAPDGGIKHVYREKEGNAMGTDQGLEALVAAKRFVEGKPALFDMSDVGGGEAIGGFTDIADSWAKDIIVKTGGFDIAGDSTLFKPEQAITRGEFALGMVKGLDLKAGEKQVSFKDVAADSRFAEAINIAASLGVIEGRGEGDFDPDATITREEAMAIVQRALNSKNIGKEYTQEEINGLLGKFTDGNAVSDWARVPAAFNIDMKIIEGRPEGIVPKGNITRGEAVKVIMTAADVK